MPRPPCRKLTLADILILVGFTAGGLALARELLPNLQQEPRWFGQLLGVGVPLLSAWTVALLGLRLRRPRPIVRLLFRQPGSAAGLVTLVVMAIWIVYVAIALTINRNTPPVQTNFVYHPIGSGAAVLGVWLLMFVTRTGRKEPGWIDRSGRCLGFAWIAMMGAVMATIFLF